MKTLLQKTIWLLLSVSVILTACSDNEPARPDSPPADDYEGSQSTITLQDETEGLAAGEIRLKLQTMDGEEIFRNARHERKGNVSTITMDKGLKEGNYRLLAAEYPQKSASPELSSEFSTDEFGLGSRIKVEDSRIIVVDSFNPQLKMAGKGSKDSPFIISSWSHLFNLMMIVNDYDLNKLITENTVFQQVCDIDMKQASMSCDIEYGWLPIGADTNTPFRGTYLGNGQKISNLILKRPHSSGIGLFGYLHNAAIDGVIMKSCNVTGQFAVGCLAGSVVTAGSNDRGTLSITNCSTENCTVSGNETSASIGGIMGATDMHSKTLIACCEVKGGSVSGGMNVGGITGGAGIYSSMMVSACSNSSTIKSMYSGAGGIVGTADTLQLVASVNTARIEGATAYSGEDNTAGTGTGGLVGGSGMSWITSSTNYGEVSGYEGVGGIIGSTRVTGSKSSGYQYNQTVLRACGNTADVKGKDFVGGAIGEAQAGTYSVYNTGNVSGDRYIGGICGNSSVAVIHNSLNSGDIEGSSYVAGLVGKTTWGSLALDQNIGTVNGKNGNTAGILALVGNNTIVHYCSNFGDITGPSSHPVGGVIAEIGDPREWTAMNIAECVVGSLEIVMSVAGPVIAVAEGAIEMAHLVEIGIKICETSVELALMASDYVLFSFGLEELISPEAEEYIHSEIESKANDAGKEVAMRIKELRMSCPGNVVGFDSNIMTENYMNNVDILRQYCDVEGNDDKFNDAINEAREKRAEKLEKVAEAKEIFHDVVSGVAIAVGTVTFIAGEVVTGGAATPILIASSAAAVVGGANALIKTCTEFETNAVVVSQCVNSGKVSSPGNGKGAAIVGRLCDGCAVADCLNTAVIDGSDNILIGNYGKLCDMRNFITLVAAGKPDYFYGLENVVAYDPNLPAGKTDKFTNVTLASKDKMADSSFFSSLGFDLGDEASWSIPAGETFPIPQRSQMQD